MLELLWLIVNIAMVVYVVKTIKENNKEQKKKKRKIWLSLLGTGIILAFIGEKTVFTVGHVTTMTPDKWITEDGSEWKVEIEANDNYEMDER